MRSTKYLTALFLLTLLANGSVIAAERREVAPFTVFGTPQSSSQREAVENLLDAFKETWATQNVQAHLELFATDAEWVNAYARMFRGKNELEVFLRDQLFPAFDSRVSQEEIRNAKLISIRYLGNDAAVLHLYTDGSRGESTIPGRDLRRTHIHLVFAQMDMQWMIVHTAIMDARN